MKTKKCWFSSALFLKSEYYSYIIFWYFWVRSWQPKRKKNWTIQKLKRWKKYRNLFISFLLPLVMTSETTKKKRQKLFSPPIHPSFSELLCYPLHSSSQDTQRKQPAIGTGTVLFFVYLAKIGSTKLDCAIIPSPPYLPQGGGGWV